MKTTKSRSSSRIITFLSILLAVVLLATGCAPKVTGTVDVPYGANMEIQVENGATGYKGLVPAFVLDGTSPYIMDLSATFTVTDVIDTRIVWADTTALVSLAGQSSQRHLSVILYLCQPLSEKADKFSDGTIAYGGTGYPEIIEGQTYTISGVLQPQWQSVPLIYVPTAYEFKKTAGDESFFYAPSDQFEQEPSSMAAKQVVEEYFKYWNGKNITEMEKRMTPNKKGIDWSFDAIEYVKLISISERQPREAGTKVFVVVFDLKYKKGKSSSLNEGRTTWEYLLKRDNETSSWLIYDWGGGGYA
ncbi:DUF4829 domain-containing protein [Candidatus Cryosericum septentrionale]|nr:DUF4829 domain-containing protein [Candidatus Cryosericum septentrionale]